MAILSKEATSLTAFKLAMTDINYLFQQGETANALAPFKYNPVQTFAEASDGFKQLATYPAFREICNRMLNPDFKIIFKSGGSIAVDDQYVALLAAQESGVVVCAQNSEDGLTIIYFTDRLTYLNWWVSIYAVEGTMDYVNLFGRSGATEIFVCAIHCVDLYRRLYMESMLDCRAMNLAVTMQEYVNTLKQVLAAGDKRWLLPTVLDLAGLDGEKISLQPEHLHAIEEFGFIKITPEGLIQLDTRATSMGTEFLIGWVGSVGWQATALVDGAEMSIGQGFLTGTSFANHLVYFEPNNGQFSHKTLSKTAIAGAVAEWLDSLKHLVQHTAIPVAEQTVMTVPELQVATTPQCQNCGKELRQGAKFCPACGTPQVAVDSGSSLH